jgi:NAD(P)-dependent dehydrogenase (short-subunit alcohol dehydrogenase family)
LITVLTGGTDGIGRHVASNLAQAGHHVVLLARSPEKAERVVSELAKGGGGGAEWVRCELDSLASVRSAAREISARHDHVDVLVNNAACFGSGYAETTDGFETHLAVNYLAPFVLTHALLPSLAATAEARIVNVSGETARFARIRLDDLNRRRSFSVVFAYAQSKLALILFTRSLAKRLVGTSITVNAVHPGPAATAHLKAGPSWLDRLWRGLVPGPQRAARGISRLAIDAALCGVSGRYYLNRLRFPAPFAAYRSRLCEDLYAETARMVSVDLDIARTLPRK